MALVVEDGSGKVDADSYVSLAYVDSYNSSRDNDASWEAATDAEKEQAIREATQYLDAEFGTRFVGRRGSKEQALDWPRIYATDRNDYAIDTNEIPARLQQVTAVMAIRAVSETLIADGTTDDTNKVAETIKVGPITVSEEFSPSKQTSKIYSLAAKLLSPIIGGLTAMERA